MVLPFQFFKYALLGVSVACPGILALFMKLNRPHFESYSEQYPQYIGLSRGSFPSTNVHVLENLPYLKSTGTESSIYQIRLLSTNFSPLHQPQSDSDTVNHTGNANHRRTHRRHTRIQTDSKTNGMEGDVNGHTTLTVLISQLPTTTNFRDLVSVVYRLSSGEVVRLYLSRDLSIENFN